MAAAKKVIRLAREEDSAALLEIYAPYINNSAVTFECEVPPVREFSERIRSISGSYPWLVCEIDDHIVGYAYASQYNSRAAYQWSVTLSVYVKEAYKRRGLAGALYATLFELLGFLGYYNVFVGITHPNIESEGFHASLGFKPVGIFHNAGFKLEKWHSVIWYELALKKPSQAPAKPVPVADVDCASIDTILRGSLDLIKI